MFYGEHLSAEEIAVTCACGITASVEVLDKYGRSHGWFCRDHAHRVRKELRKQEKLARAIVRKGSR
jgi:hypothetical protein